MLPAVSVRQTDVRDAMGIAADLPDSRDPLHVSRCHIARPAAVDACPHRSTGLVLRYNADPDVQQHQRLFFPAGVFPENDETGQPDNAPRLVTQSIRCGSDTTDHRSAAHRNMLWHAARLHCRLLHDRLVEIPHHGTWLINIDLQLQG